MKKLFNQKLLVLALIACVLSACNDEESVKTKGDFTLGEETTKISSGYFIYDTSPNSDDDGNEYHRNQLYFFGAGLKVVGSGNNADLTGEGNMLELYINNEDEELQVGTYTWQEEENEQPFDLWSGYVTIDANTNDETLYRLQSGTVTVKKSGSTYKITFSGEAYFYDDSDFDKQAGLAPLTVTAQFEGKIKRIGVDF